uniref:Rho termination factor N-terminal domain-containing protein n=1 Tax=viral metagenome TaxID=1070528 RepID=A0A6M3M5U1_9ZZZZ
MTYTEMTEMNVKALKATCKDNGIKGYSSWTRDQLVAALETYEAHKVAVEMEQSKEAATPEFDMDGTRFVDDEDELDDETWQEVQALNSEPDEQLEAVDELEAEVEQETVETEGTGEFDAVMDSTESTTKKTAKKREKKVTAMAAIAGAISHPDGATVDQLVQAVLEFGRSDDYFKALANVAAYLGYLSTGYGSGTNGTRREQIAERAWTIERTDSVMRGTAPESIPEGIRPVVSTEDAGRALMALQDAGILAA